MLTFTMMIILAVFGGAFGNISERCWIHSIWTVDETDYIPIRSNGVVFIYVKCKNPTHYPDPPNLVKCIGTYTETSLPRCKKSDWTCSKISSPVHGSMTCDKWPPSDGTTCRFKCSKGYQMRGSESRTCYHHYWNGKTTSCIQRVECPSGKYLAHGEVSNCSYPPLQGEVCSYSCHEGYRLSGYRKLLCSPTSYMTTLRRQRVPFPVCERIVTYDGCRNANGGCSHECRQESLNSPHWCECPIGWKLKKDNRTCKDPRPSCRNRNGECSHECHEKDGSVTCSCPHGFQLGSDGKSCNDIDECSLNNFGCSHVCINTLGWAKCICRDGYTLSTDEKTCIAYSRRSCHRGNGECSHGCEEKDGSVTCLCRDGFQLGSDGKSCIDIDECSLNNFGCSHVCINTLGWAKCICRDGYTLSTDEKTCIAYSGRSCHRGNGECSHGCEENYGSVTCSCPDGFQLGSDGKSCNDINECSLDNFGCSHECKNRVGGAECVCRDGYRLSRDQKTCKDIDECSSPGLNKCEQTCHNTEGNYTCSCEAGYVLFKSVKCQACRFHSYWTASDSSCTECPPHSYTKREGSTSIADCICRPGFTGDPAQYKDCTDINECLDNNFGCSHDCLNSVGSVMCTCPKGFELGADLKTCKDVDECSVKNGGCQGTCHNFEGGFNCSCADGFILSKTYFCIDVNECEDNNGNCSDICVNVPGGYHCSCPPGYHVDRGGKNCQALLCPQFVLPQNSRVECSVVNSPKKKAVLKSVDPTQEEFPPNTICKAFCQRGFTMVDTKARSIIKCADDGTWNASITLSCQGLNCPPLSIEDPVIQIHPPECTQQPMEIQSVCHVSCPANHRLKGRPHFTCNKTLQWFKQDTLTMCIPVNPFLSCPEDISLGLQGLNDSSALIVLPPPQTNVAYLVKHQPDWVKLDSHTLFPVGKTQVTYTINEPRMNLTMRCDFSITVIDDVSPIFDYCPESIQVEADSFYGAEVSWREPLAFDNVAIDSFLKTSEPNTTLKPGLHNVKYVVKDAAGNMAECSFEINVLTSDTECGELKDPLNGEANCMELHSGGVFCEPLCNDNYTWLQEPEELYTCNATGHWSPSTEIPDCVPECKVGSVWSEEKQKCEFKTIDIPISSA